MYSNCYRQLILLITYSDYVLSYLMQSILYILIDNCEAFLTANQLSMKVLLVYLQYLYAVV